MMIRSKRYLASKVCTPRHSNSHVQAITVTIEFSWGVSMSVDVNNRSSIED